MGILITQRKDKWFINMREQWLFLKKSQLDKVMSFFLESGVPVKIDGVKSEGDIEYYLTIENKEISFDSFGDMEDYLGQVLEYKQHYGELDGRNGSD